MTIDGMISEYADISYSFSASMMLSPVIPIRRPRYMRYYSSILLSGSWWYIKFNISALCNWATICGSAMCLVQIIELCTCVVRRT